MWLPFCDLLHGGMGKQNYSREVKDKGNDGFRDQEIPVGGQGAQELLRNLNLWLWRVPPPHHFVQFLPQDKGTALRLLSLVVLKEKPGEWILNRILRRKR